MREILFRGKALIDVECPDYCGESDVKNGDWVFGDLIWNNGVPFIVKNVIESNWEYISIEAWTPVDPSTVGQYTGLKDRNGKMIFEGDIFTSDYFKDGEKFEVVFRYGAFCGESNRTGLFPLGFTNDYYETGDDDDDFYYPEDYTSHIQIIGNIHDQKEDV